jgi:hypothetical protein
MRVRRVGDFTDTSCSAGFYPSGFVLENVPQFSGYFVPRIAVARPCHVPNGFDRGPRGTPGRVVDSEPLYNG